MASVYSRLRRMAASRWKKPMMAASMPFMTPWLMLTMEVVSTTSPAALKAPCTSARSMPAASAASMRMSARKAPASDMRSSAAALPCVACVSTASLNFAT